jgi:hypothetical protein
MDLKKEFEQADMLISQSKRVNMQIKIAKKYAEYTQALQLLQPDVISSVRPEWLKKDIVDSVKNLWNLPNDDNSNPRTSAIKLVRKQAKHYGYEIDLKKAVEIVKEHCL